MQEPSTRRRKRTPVGYASASQQHVGDIRTRSAVDPGPETCELSLNLARRRLLFVGASALVPALVALAIYALHWAVNRDTAPPVQVASITSGDTRYAPKLPVGVDNGKDERSGPAPLENDKPKRKPKTAMRPNKKNKSASKKKRASRSTRGVVMPYSRGFQSKGQALGKQSGQRPGLAQAARAVLVKPKDEKDENKTATSSAATNGEGAKTVTPDTVKEVNEKERDRRTTEAAKVNKALYDLEESRTGLQLWRYPPSGAPAYVDPVRLARSIASKTISKAELAYRSLRGINGTSLERRDWRNLTAMVLAPVRFGGSCPDPRNSLAYFTVLFEAYHAGKPGMANLSVVKNWCPKQLKQVIQSLVRIPRVLQPACADLDAATFCRAHIRARIKDALMKRGSPDPDNKLCKEALVLLTRARPADIATLRLAERGTGRLARCIRKHVLTLLANRRPAVQTTESVSTPKRVANVDEQPGTWR